MTSAKFFALGLSFMLSSLFWFPSTSAADAIVTIDCVPMEMCKIDLRSFLLPDDGEELGAAMQDCAAMDGCRPSVTQTGGGNVIKATCQVVLFSFIVVELPRGGRDLAIFTSGCAMDGGDLTIDAVMPTPQP